MVESLVSDVCPNADEWLPVVFDGRGGVNGCSCFLCPVASGATQVWPRHYPPRRPRWTGPSGVWMTPACRCPLIWATSSTEWSRCSGGGPGDVEVWKSVSVHKHTHASSHRLFILYSHIISMDSLLVLNNVFILT